MSTRKRSLARYTLWTEQERYGRFIIADSNIQLRREVRQQTDIELWYSRLEFYMKLPGAEIITHQKGVFACSIARCLQPGTSRLCQTCQSGRHRCYLKLVRDLGNEGFCAMLLIKELWLNL